MGKIIKTMIWLLVLAGLSAGLMIAQPRLRYHLRDGKLNWIGAQLAQPSREYDYAFIGSSHTWNGLDAARIGRELAGSADRAINLAINWDGRDVHGLIARDFLARHKVKNLVVECFLYETPKSHPYFPYLCLPADVFGHAKARPLADRRTWDLAGDYKKPVNFVLDNIASLGVKGYFRLYDKLTWSGPSPEKLADYNRERGSYLYDGSPESRKKWLAEQKVFTAPPKTDNWSPTNVDNWRKTIWNVELTGLARLCRQKGVRLAFVFLPRRVNHRPSPGYRKYLRGLGDIIPFPREINADPALWRNATHLNIAGAKAMTDHFIALEKERRAALKNRSAKLVFATQIP